MFKFITELKTLKKKEGISKQEAAEMMAVIRLPQWLEMISLQTGWLIVASMWLGATFACALFLVLATSKTLGWSLFERVALLSLAPVVFAVSFVVIGGAFGLVGRAGVFAGKFPRSLSHPIYALRRIYGTSWTQIFYFKPLYAVLLAIPSLRKALFRLYGYRGKNNFTLYPDAWIRDLPMLTIGEGAYIANRCTIGTNICLSDGSILVGPCQFGDGAIVGHLTVFALGGKLGKSSELGVAVTFGIRSTVGDHTSISPKAFIYHGVEIGNHVKIGFCAVIGMKARIADGVHIKVAAVIPNGANIDSQATADRHFSSEMDLLKTRREDLTETLRKNFDEFNQGSR